MDLAVIGVRKLPLEVLDKIFSSLDRESLIAASNVCVNWKKVIHDYTSTSTSSCDPDPDLQEKLKKCGWIMNEHDVEKCQCIELNTGLLKYITSEFLSCRVLSLNTDRLVSKNKPICISNNKLCYIDSKTNCASLTENDSVSIIDLSRNSRAEIDLSEHINTVDFMGVMDEEEVKAMCAHDKTLVIVCGTPYYDSITVWNLETLQYVTELNILDQEKIIGIKDVSRNDVEVRFHGVALDKGKLAVNIKFRQIKDGRYCIVCQTLLWKLDTEDPSTESIRYWKTIVLDHIYSESEKYLLRMFMNSKLLVLTIRKKLVVFNLVNLSKVNSSIEIKEEFSYRNRVLTYDIMLEKEMSYKIAVFNKRRNHLTIYKIESNSYHFWLGIDLNHFIAKEPSALSMTNFLMGKVMLILNSARHFQCIIVTEDGLVVEGNKQETRRNHPISKFIVHADGIVALTSRYGVWKKRLLFYHPE